MLWITRKRRARTTKDCEGVKKLSRLKMNWREAGLSEYMSWKKVKRDFVKEIVKEWKGRLNETVCVSWWIFLSSEQLQSFLTKYVEILTRFVQMLTAFINTIPVSMTWIKHNEPWEQVSEYFRTLYFRFTQEDMSYFPRCWRYKVPRIHASDHQLRTNTTCSSSYFNVTWPSNCMFVMHKSPKRKQKELDEKVHDLVSNCPEENQASCETT